LVKKEQHETEEHKLNTAHMAFNLPVWHARSLLSEEGNQKDI